MKAVINEKETPVKYPWIGKANDCDNFIVAFWDEKRATALTDSGGFIVGMDYSANSTYRIKDFTPITGSITLSND